MVQPESGQCFLDEYGGVKSNWVNDISECLRFSYVSIEGFAGQVESQVARRGGSMPPRRRSGHKRRIEGVRYIQR